MNVVTGAFGYIGKYIAQHLLDLGEKVKTITTHPQKPNPFGKAVQAYPYYFNDPDKLIKILREVSTLYNTYWIRFEYGGHTFKQTLKNTATLFECAQKAGVKKIVHISVTQVSSQSSLPYYRGKAMQEEMLAKSDVPYTIVRPTLVFGKEDILVNNIAWLIRHFPLFPIFGSGDYKTQPVFVGDLAKIAVDAVGEPSGKIIDAIGPETFTFEEMVHLIAKKIGCKPLFIHVAPQLGVLLGRIIGLFHRDIILTRDELTGLMQSLLTSGQKPNGTTIFSNWLQENKETVGASYTSELERHFKYPINRSNIKN